MGRVSNPELVAAWRRRVEGQPRSGLSIEEYCRREGISAGTFYAWKRRLKVLKAASASTRRKSKRNRAKREPIDSKRVGHFVQVPLTISTTIQVRFADGTVVSLPPDNLAALSTTLRTLRAAQLEGGSDD